MVIIIMAIVAVAGGPMITSVVQSMLIYEQTAYSTAQGRLAMERMSRELRQQPSDRGTLMIVPSTEITFTSSATGGEQVRYYLKDNGWPDGEDLMRQVNDAEEQILARGISDLLFTYDGAAADLNYIQFSLTVNVNRPGSGTGAVSYPFRTRVYPRNF